MLLPGMMEAAGCSSAPQTSRAWALAGTLCWLPCRDVDQSLTGVIEELCEGVWLLGEGFDVMWRSASIIIDRRQSAAAGGAVLADAASSAYLCSAEGLWLARLGHMKEESSRSVAVHSQQNILKEESFLYKCAKARYPPKKEKRIKGKTMLHSKQPPLEKLQRFRSLCCRSCRKELCRNAVCCEERTKKQEKS